MVYKLLPENIQDTANDQEYFTKLYFNSTVRLENKIILDSEARIFQTFHGASSKNEFKIMKLRLK